MFEQIAVVDLPNALGYAGTATGMMWPLCRGRTSILIAQIVSNILFTLHYLMLGADTGAALSVLSVLQAAAAIPLGERPGFRYVYLATLPVIAGTLALTWNGAPSVFASLGTALVSLGRYQTDIYRMRLVLFAAGPGWFIHNLIVWSVPGMTTDALCATLNARVLIRMFRERTRAVPA